MVLCVVGLMLSSATEPAYALSLRGGKAGVRGSHFGPAQARSPYGAGTRPGRRRIMVQVLLHAAFGMRRAFAAQLSLLPGPSHDGSSRRWPGACPGFGLLCWSWYGAGWDVAHLSVDYRLRTHAHRGRSSSSRFRENAKADQHQLCF